MAFLTPTKILIQRADKLGDVIVSLPVFYALKQRFPACELHLLTSSVGALITETIPYIDRVMVCTMKNDRLKDKATWVKTLRRENYSHYIALWNHPALASLGKRCGIPVCIGDATHFFLKRYYTHPVRQTWEDFSKHQIEFNLQLLKPFGIEPSLEAAPIPPSHLSLQSLKEKVGAVFDAALPTVFIFSVTGGTNYPIPEVPLRGFIEKLLEMRAYNVILGGQAEGNHPFLQWKKKGLINLINKTTFSELVAAISVCDVYIGPDTGPTHIASFMKKPMVFFSSMKSNPPVRWGPLSEAVAYIRQDYVCPHFCVRKCYPESCFSFVSEQILLDAFEQVVSHPKRSETQSAKTSHLLASVRVLYLTRSLTEYEAVYPVAKRLRDQGLMVFPYVLQRWSLFKAVYVLRLVIKHNVNVLQGDIPLWLVRLVQWTMGAIFVYLKPIYIPIKLSSVLRLKEYLEIYVKVWRTHR